MMKILALLAAFLSAQAAQADRTSFLWGTAFSAHQTEGGDDGSDWWDWEHTSGKIARGETTLIACDHYHRYPEDFEIAQSLGLDAVRLSVSWPRIEPQPGVFDEKELNHYRDVVLELRSRGLEPVITLHHFTHPRWFQELGGWERADSPEIFARFAAKVADALFPYVQIWITFNEPLVLVTDGYLKAAYPPGIQSFTRATAAFENLVRAHGLAARELRRMTPPNVLGLPVHGVGLALNMYAFDSLHDPGSSAGKGDLKAIAELEQLQHWAFLEAVQTGILKWDISPNFLQLSGQHEKKAISDAEHSLDWVGVNYYSRYKIEKRFFSPLGMKWTMPEEGFTFPAGLGRVLRGAAAHLPDHLPLLV
ncbi:MAG: glycoside hydrolase family 1 protein, partial [Bdellovibrionota bacterium]